ncbi:glutathione S-transferase family protein [Xinfangfangia pollutisoli]|uniref:glutathione S-transferase family protein n=1 Tax=Xinfangfangia pollutisoli TaxID=2865960 RepID=UPI001CD7FBA0|nr:glutathione S-transferase [Xinfangfangia pollutisoli]
MKIWGRVNSSNVRKVLWCAEELGLTYTREDAGGAFGVVDTPEYRALNPNGLVPCLEDDGLVLWESNTIVRYLARQYGQPPFAPADPKAWAAAEKWMDWTSLSFAQPFRDMFWNMVRLTPETRDAEAMARGTAETNRLMQRADAGLAGAPWFSGAAFGIGDIPLGCLAYGWFNLPIERPAVPALSNWYARLTERPAYRKAVMTPLT